uniref:Uncharacterized protein n=1 Tax=Populus alba TaxID=43335 RepID=A0A4V6A8E7_POPAL|nr:hypothetical protein D5086_0000161070 [Populus alba]
MPRSIDFFFSFSEQSPERLNANQIGSFIQSSPSERARELQSDLGSGESSRRAVGAKQLLCGKRCHYLPADERRLPGACPLVLFKVESRNKYSIVNNSPAWLVSTLLPEARIRRLPCGGLSGVYGGSDQSRDEENSDLPLRKVSSRQLNLSGKLLGAPLTITNGQSVQGAIFGQSG